MIDKPNMQFLKWVVNSNTWKNKECKKKSLGLPSVLGRDNYDGWLGYNIQTENIKSNFVKMSWFYKYRDT
jgi:hypothetical protein